MKVKQLSRAQAVALFKRYDLNVIVWCSHTITGGKYNALIADYSTLAAYDVAFACSIYDRRGALLERFNVMKGGRS